MPPPGSDVTSNVPPEAATRSARPRSPSPSDQRHPRRRRRSRRSSAGRRLGRGVQPDRRRSRVLGDVGQRFRGHEIGRRCGCSGDVAPQVHLQRRPAPANGPRAPAAPASGRPRSAPPGGSRGPARGRPRRRRAPRPPRAATRVPPSDPVSVLAGRPAQGHRQGHEPLLDAVVQVPFDPTTLGIAGLDDPCP